MDITDKPLSAEEKEFILNQIEAATDDIIDAFRKEFCERFRERFIEYIKRESEAIKTTLSEDEIITNEIKDTEAKE